MEFVFSWAVLVQFCLAVVLPLLVAVVTKRTQSGRLRGVLLAALTVATTLLTTLAAGLSGQPVEWFAVLLTAVGSFVVSVGFHFGLWGAKGPDGTSISATIIENVGAK